MQIPLDEIESKVKEIIKNVLNVGDEEISSDSNIESLGGDSLSALSILSALERDFEIDIPDDVAMKINSLPTAVQIVKDCLGIQCDKE